jgi:hypothetical protein
LAEPLNYPPSPFPGSRQKLIFRTYEKVLRNDSVLSACVHTWATWRGEDVDMIDGDKVTDAMCPMLRISPWPVQSERYTERQHRMPMSMHIQLFVVGTNADFLLDFSAAVHHAIDPQDDDAQLKRVQAMFSEINWTVPTTRMNAYGAWSNVDGIPIMGAEGSVEFNTLI